MSATNGSEKSNSSKIPEGFILNPDQELVKRVKNGIWKRKGHCPCIIEMSPATMCPCEDFIKNHDCHCKLYIKKD